MLVSLSACRGNPSPAVSFISVETPQAVAAPITADGAFEDKRSVAVRVNHQPIFLETYEKQIVRFEQTLVKQGVDLTSERGQAALAQVRQRILETLIDQSLIEQEATRLNIVITEQAIEVKVQENIAQVQGQAQFEAWLTANDLSYEEFRETLRTQLIANEVFAAITRDIAENTEKERAFATWLMRQRSAAIIEHYVVL